jgi:hypothetical protein
MIDSPDEMAIIVALFFVVSVLNVRPALAPPTWMTPSFVGLVVPNVNVIALAVVGAAAATLGRIALAKLSRRVVRHGLLREPARLNIDAIKQGIEGRALTSTAFMDVRVESIAMQLPIHRLWTYLPANHVACRAVLCRSAAEQRFLGDDRI